MRAKAGVTLLLFAAIAGAAAEKLRKIGCRSLCSSRVRSLTFRLFGLAQTSVIELGTGNRGQTHFFNYFVRDRASRQEIA
jgi:hypothetical protein